MVNNWAKYDTIAVDFDGTICEFEYPAIGPLIPRAKEVLTRYKEQGGHIVIWTCRCGPRLAEAIMWLKAQGVPFDNVNMNMRHRERAFGGDTRKVSADLYIDDKNPGGVDWDQIEEILFGGG